MYILERLWSPGLLPSPQRAVAVKQRHHPPLAWLSQGEAPNMGHQGSCRVRYCSSFRETSVYKVRIDSLTEHCESSARLHDQCSTSRMQNNDNRIVSLHVGIWLARQRGITAVSIRRLEVLGDVEAVSCVRSLLRRILSASLSSLMKRSIGVIYSSFEIAEEC